MNRRAYDYEPGCTRLMDSVQAIAHPEIQAYVARLILTVAEKVQDQILGRGGGTPLKSLGLPALKNLYQSKSQHRRWYDQDPLLKQAFKTFYTLPMEGLTALCFKLVDPVGLIALYAFVCEQLGTAPTPYDLQEITRVSLYEGREEAEALLSNLVGSDLLDAFSESFSRTGA